MTALIRWLVIGEINDAAGVSQEVVLAQGEVSPYHPSSIDSIVFQGLREAGSRIDELSAAGRPPQVLQLSLRPLLAGEARPSFALSAEAIGALADMAVALDFDPY